MTNTVGAGRFTGAMELHHVDCAGCVARGPACGGCVMSVLLGPVSVTDESFAPDERVALAALADGGLLPPLRLVRAEAPQPAEIPSALWIPGLEPFADSEDVV